MANELSPEERLLRLIKEKQQNAAAKENHGIVANVDMEIKADEEKPRPAPALPAKDIERQDIKRQNRRRPGISVGWLNSLKPYLYAAAAIIFLSFAVIFITRSFSSKEDREISDLKTMLASLSQDTAQKENIPQQPREGKPEKMPDESAPESFVDYEKLIKEKNIFTSAQPEKGKAAIQQGETLRAMTKDLKLVGIMPGDEPQAIIEDKKSSQTLFLKEGEMINDVEVKKIMTGKVVLGYGDEQITLSM
jgi:hypothetical protein